MSTQHIHFTSFSSYHNIIIDRKWICDITHSQHIHRHQLIIEELVFEMSFGVNSQICGFEFSYCMSQILYTLTGRGGKASAIYQSSFRPNVFSRMAFWIELLRSVHFWLSVWCIIFLSPTFFDWVDKLVLRLDTSPPGRCIVSLAPVSLIAPGSSQWQQPRPVPQRLRLALRVLSCLTPPARCLAPVTTLPLMVGPCLRVTWAAAVERERANRLLTIVLDEALTVTAASVLTTPAALGGTAGPGLHAEAAQPPLTHGRLAATRVHSVSRHQAPWA